MNVTKKTIAPFVAIFISCFSGYSQQNADGGYGNGTIQRNEVDNTPVSVSFSSGEMYTAARTSEIFAKYFPRHDSL